MHEMKLHSESGKSRQMKEPRKPWTLPSLTNKEQYYYVFNTFIISFKCKPEGFILIIEEWIH